MQLSKAIFNFTDTQDVRLLVGCDALVNDRGQISKVSQMHSWTEQGCKLCQPGEVARCCPESCVFCCIHCMAPQVLSRTAC